MQSAGWLAFRPHLRGHTGRYTDIARTQECWEVWRPYRLCWSLRYKQLYSIGTEPVTGLEYQQFPGSEEKYFVMATDSTTVCEDDIGSDLQVSPSKRIHQFVWGPSFEANFSNLSKTKVLPGLFLRTSLSIYGKKGAPIDVCLILSASDSIVLRVAICSWDISWQPVFCQWWECDWGWYWNFATSKWRARCCHCPDGIPLLHSSRSSHHSCLKNY